MAPYFRDPNLDKQDENNPGTVTVSSAGEQAGTDGTVQGSESANRPTGSGSKFTNIDSYLNGGNAAQFGQEFGGKIQSSINDAKSNFDTTAGKVEGRINSQGETPSQDQISGYISNAGANTTDDDAKKYQTWLNQSYQGPHGIADNQSAWNEYWGKAADAKTAAQESGTEGGRFALLDKYYGRPNYNFGQKSLDNLLVQTGGGFNNAADLQKQATGLDAYGQQKSEEVSNAAAQRAAQIEQSKSAARSAIGLGDNNQIQGGALGQFQNDLDSRVAADNAKRSSNYTNLINDIGSGNVSNADMSYLGGVPRGTPLYDLNLANYVQRGGDVSRATEATDSDYSKYLALSKLAGLNPTVLTPDQRSLAGKVDPELTFDRNRFDADQASAQRAYEQNLSAPIHLATAANPMTIPQMKEQLTGLKNSGMSDADIQKYINSNSIGAAFVREIQGYVNDFDKKYGNIPTLQGDSALPGMIYGSGASRR